MQENRRHDPEVRAAWTERTELSRRTLLRAGLLAGGALTLGPAFYREAFATAATGTRVGTGPYGAPSVTNPLGIRLPRGFTAREIARGGEKVASTNYRWHHFTDGQAAFPTADGGWILVSNSEAQAVMGGGCSAIRFASDGTIADAYRVLGATQLNCAGGPTPWGTWLSGEEWAQGNVWEVDPTAPRAKRRAALGTFTHESVCVDPVREQLYLTEDRPNGFFYRFTPTAYPSLTAGRLEVAVVAADGAVTWIGQEAAATGVAQGPPGTRFNGGEGTWWDGGIAYFTTKGDNRVWAYDCARSRIEVLYDAAKLGPSAPLRGVDNVCVSAAGDLYVCEDGDDLDLCLITPDREVSRFLTFDGAKHPNSELTGVTFDPSGSRMYISSQRSFSLGALYEITGPFRMPTAPTRPPSFGRARGSGKREYKGGTLVRVRVAGSVAQASLRTDGLAVRLALREPCVVRTTLKGEGRVLATHRFAMAVTSLTALRLRSTKARAGERCEVVARVTPTAGGATVTVRAPVTVSA